MFKIPIVCFLCAFLAPITIMAQENSVDSDFVILDGYLNVIFLNEKFKNKNNVEKYIMTFTRHPFLYPQLKMAKQKFFLNDTSIIILVSCTPSVNFASAPLPIQRVFGISDNMWYTSQFPQTSSLTRFTKDKVLEVVDHRRCKIKAMDYKLLESKYGVSFNDMSCQSYGEPALPNDIGSLNPIYFIFEFERMDD
jgi:hypothetical protein